MKVITIGKRHVLLQDVALVEPFDPTSNADFKPEKDFKGRILLVNRDVVLTEQTPHEFAADHGLHVLGEDGIAVNRSVSFKVETFEPTESFKPAKDYKTRIRWRDANGSEHSKLLLTAPDVFVEQTASRAAEPAPSSKGPPRRVARGRNGSRRMEAYRS